MCGRDCVAGLDLGLQATQEIVAIGDARLSAWCGDTPLSDVSGIIVGIAENLSATPPIA